MDQPESFIAFSAAAKRLGVAPLTLRQRIQKGEVPVFEHPLDARFRLLRLVDVERLAKREPRPAGQPKAATAA